VNTHLQPGQKVFYYIIANVVAEDKIRIDQSDKGHKICRRCNGSSIFHPMSIYCKVPTERKISKWTLTLNGVAHVHTSGTENWRGFFVDLQMYMQAP
jgi:hypothetical protein